MKTISIAILAAALFTVTASRTDAATFTVVNINDSGAGSFRQAIIDANNNPGADRIEFNIPGPSPYIISPVSTLPLTYIVVIDGTTQPGFAGRPIIELRGQNAGIASDGLTLRGSVTVQGLVINSFSRDGILMDGDASVGNVIRGSFIGTDVSGLASRPNGRFGIRIATWNNVVGGTNAAARNVISGNTLSGINIDFIDARGNKIQGNYIGLNADGAGALGNGQDGIFISKGDNNTIGGTGSGAGNVISGNLFSGIEIAGGTMGTAIYGNLIGTSADGTRAIGNRQAGIFINTGSYTFLGGAPPLGARNVISGNGIVGVQVSGFGASNNQIRGNYIGTDVLGTSALGNALAGVNVVDVSGNTIGSAEAGEGNVISGNGLSGVIIQGAAATRNKVQGNFIGTDKTGTRSIANLEDGIFVTGGRDNIIGGAEPGAANLLSGNGLSGIEIWDSASGNLVQGNFIGTDIGGTNSVGNRSHGIFIQNSSANTVGGPVAGAGNLIAYNVLDGVFMESGTANLIRGNPIWGNGGLGIDLGANEVTPNDNGDADSGANQLQNFPVLWSAVANSDGTTSISGSLNSRPSGSFTIEFFANAACDPSGNGEGQEVIGLANIATTADGSNTFSVTFTNTVPTGSVITATATDSFNNTSEFSSCVPVIARPRLLTSRSGTQLVFAWPATTDSGFVLLYTTNLALPIVWRVATNKIVEINGQKKIAVEASINAQFYRLAKE